MKKLFLFIACFLFAITMMAQEARLHCVGNDYYYAGQVLDRSQMLDFYAQHNCQAAYDRFKEGQRVATIGWAFLGVGVGLDLGAVACFGALMFNRYAPASSSNMPARATADSSFNTSDPAYFAMVALGTGAALFELASIPCLVVGFHKQHTSVDVYNILNGQAENTSLRRDNQPYWALQSSVYGLGLALHF